MFIKTFDAQGNLTGAQQIEEPVYVRWQPSNGMMARCAEEDAQGIIGTDGTAYLLNGAQPHGEPEPYAEIITEAEYEEIIAGFDPEDDTPVVPDPEPEEPPLTRAELTAIVTEQAETIQMLTDCLLEMSEIVYG